MITGKPYSSTNAWASPGSETGPGVPGTTGTLFFIAGSQSRFVSNGHVPIVRALVLSPRESMTSGLGPMKTKPASSTFFAKEAFSERNPYPGWIIETL